MNWLPPQLPPPQLPPPQLPPFQLRPLQLRPFQLRPFQLRPLQLRPLQLRNVPDVPRLNVAPPRDGFDMVCPRPWPRGPAQTVLIETAKARVIEKNAFMVPKYSLLTARVRLSGCGGDCAADR